MIVAYCKECDEVIAAGNLPARSSKGKTPAYRHTVKGKSHEATLREISDTPRNPVETVGKYLKRLSDSIKG